MHNLLIFFLLLFPNVSNDLCTITIKVENISNDDGSILLAFYDNEEDFLKKGIIKRTLKIKNGTAEVSIKDLKYGEYAIAVIHDENDNGKLDFHFYGPPSEKTGTSNNVKTLLLPPSWDDAKFQINKASKAMIIRM